MVGHTEAEELEKGRSALAAEVPAVPVERRLGEAAPEVVGEFASSSSTQREGHARI